MRGRSCALSCSAMAGVCDDDALAQIEVFAALGDILGELDEGNFA